MISQINAAAHAIHCVIGIKIFKIILLSTRTRTKTSLQLIATTQKIVLIDRATPKCAFAIRITNHNTPIGSQTFNHIEVYIQHIVSTGNGFGASIHFGEKTQTLQTQFRGINIRERSHPTFHLAHFSTQYIVTGAGVAIKINPPHIGAFAGAQQKLQINRIFLGIHQRHGLHLGKGKTTITKYLLHFLRDIEQSQTRKGSTRQGHYQIIDLLFGHGHFTRNSHFTNLKFSPFININSNKHLRFIRRNSYLGGLNIKQNMTTV